jgi:hypothetical protein
MRIEMAERAASSLGTLRDAGIPVELPAAYAEYGLFVETLRESGLMGSLRERTLNRRAGSYELIDLVLFLVCYFSSTTSTMSLVDFVGESAEYGPELAALGGRARWLTQSSLSRALAAVGEEQSCELTQLLLGLTKRALKESPVCAACGYRDGEGNAWRVLHWDTTADTVRHRALPEGPELPEGRRLSEELSAPGYAGRKRGEGVFARSIISDATSSLWLHMALNCGSGSVTEQMKHAVEDTLAFFGDDAESLSRTVVVCDGVSGGLPQTRAALTGGLHVLTRFSEYTVLESLKAQHRLESGKWHAVEDSLSGPRREALDLATRVIEGKPVRIIVSRFRAHARSAARQRGAGITIGEWHYELFLSSLPSTGWAANDLVTLYYGRTAIENRFAAEDREFALSRVFSFSKPGQQLASAIAMTLWNFRVVAGLASVPDATPPRPIRVRTTTADLPPSPETVHSRIARVGPEISEHTADPVVEAEEPSHAAIADTTSEDPMNGETAAQCVWTAAEPLLERWCVEREGWTWQDSTLHCPAGRRLSPGIRTRNEQVFVRFRAPRNACGQCQLRHQCTSTDSPHFRKHVELRVHLAASTACPSDSAAASDHRPVAKAAPSPHSKLASTAIDIMNDDQSNISPLNLPDAPTLLPARLRKLAAELFDASKITVIAPPMPNDEDDENNDDEELKCLDAQEAHIAPDPETRQRRRITIAKRVAANDRPSDFAPTVVLNAPKAYIFRMKRLFNSVRSA